MSSDTQSRYDEVCLYYRVCTNIDRYFLNYSFITVIELAFTHDMLNSFYVTRGHNSIVLGQLIPDTEITKTGDTITYSRREITKTGNTITYSRRTFARAGLVHRFYGSVQDFLRTEYVGYSKEILQYIDSIKLLSML